jgi:hypothetical protein
MRVKRRLFSVLLTALLLLPLGWSTVLSQTCTHSVVLYDTFGDGWTTYGTPAYHYLTVRVNGVAVLTDITLPNGSQSTPFTFQAATNDVISTTFTNNGSWANECYYTIYNNINTPLATGYYQSLPSVLGSCQVAPPPPSPCDFKITMGDSYGDGWNGCYLRIYINGVLTYTNITLPSGSGPGYYNFTVSHGDEVRVTFVPGSWPEEAYYTISQGGVIVFTDGAQYSYIQPSANYSYVGTGNCASDLAVESVLLGYADGYWARREAPDANVVRAAVSVQSGPQPASITATYKVGSAPIDINDGVNETIPVTWNSGIAELEFTQRLDALTPGIKTVYVALFQDADPNATNDIGFGSAVIETAEIQGNEDFQYFAPPSLAYDGYFDMGWTIDDLNAGSTWETVADGGNIALSYPGGVADDWIFAPSALLQQFASYRLQGSMRTTGSAPKTIELAFGPAADPTQMTVFATISGFSNTSYMEFKNILGSLFDPYFNTGVGVVPTYIGIHLTSSGVTDPVFINYLSLNDNPTPPPIIGYGLPGMPVSSYIDDPAIPIKVTAAYKVPGKINRTYSVTNTTDIYGTNGDFLWDVETTTPWITLTKETPDPTLQAFNFTPPRPRQFQTFTMTVNPSGLAPGVYNGEITFYGILFCDEFPPPASGLVAINEPFTVPVELRISNTGLKGGPLSVCHAISTPMTSGNIYNFADANTGERIAEVEVTGGVIDNMTICVFPKQLPQNITRMRYIERYWQIQATGTGWTANITLPYADQEAGMIVDRMQLRGIRQASPLSVWEDPIFGTTSISNPPDNSVTVNDFNEMNYSGNICLAHPYMLVKDGAAAVPEELSLGQNYPNPFNPTTTIQFAIPEEGSVRLRIFDFYGREIATLVDDFMQPGYYNTTFDATSHSSGNYIYQLEVNGAVITKQMTLMK